MMGHLHINESCRSHAADPIYFSRQTDRQARQVPTSCRITPNYRISISTSGLSGQQPSTQWVPPPTSPPLLPPTTRSRANLIGSGEFKIPACDWDCHHPGQHCKATTYPSYHRAAQQSRKPDSGYCLANSTVYFTHRCARITQLWLIGREGTNVWITVLLLLPPVPGKQCLMQDLVFDMWNLLMPVNYCYHCWCSRGYCGIWAYLIHHLISCNSILHAQLLHHALWRIAWRRFK